MSIFAAIDPVLYAWAAENGLHVATTYRDEEVRSMSVVGPAGQEIQIWIEARSGRYKVNAARNIQSRHKRRHWSSEPVTADALPSQLDAALAEGQKWISEPGAS